MINKIFQRIFIRYSNIFKFLFYLKYLFLIFFVSSLAYISAPKFINFQSKQVYIKKYLNQNYKLKIKDIEKIQYNIFPLPNLEIANSTLNFNNSDLLIKAKSIHIFFNILKIYDFQNFNPSKINLINSEVEIKAKDLVNLYKKIINQKNKINFNNTRIDIYDEYKPILSLNGVNYSNYGYKKNEIYGKVFNKKFKIRVTEKLDKISFKLDNTGIFGEIVFLNNINTKFKKGNFKAKILNSNIKFNFTRDKQKLIIKDYIFRNKYLSHNSDGEIILSPFLSINFSSTIKDIKKDAFYKIDLNKLLKNKDFLKRLNINQEINFSSKRFTGNPVKDLKAKINLAYGRIVSKKKIYLEEGEINCTSEINLIEEYPILIIKCFIKAPDKKKFIGSFLPDYKEKQESLNLEVKANLNINKKKINFLKIDMNNKYQASEEDLKFFKNIFEITFFDASLLEIFNKKKINKFLNEIL